MKQYNPFRDVGPCPYGSPMGRRGDNPRDLQHIKRLAARRQGGGEGYDKGGAYWGLPSNVWGVWGTVNGEILRTYVRASSRDHAISLVRNPVY